MKTKEKKLAINLRRKGWSMNDIKKELGISKSSVSLWVRNIELTNSQKQELSHRGIKKEVIEKRRQTRLGNENARRRIIIDRAKDQINDLSKRELKLIGAALYWGEGSKRIQSQVNFSNSDPFVIQVIMRFFKEVCNVSEEKFRGHIHLHPHLDDNEAKKYWSTVSGIPIEQFYKTTMQNNKASKGKRDSLPFGTLAVQICNTELLLKIKGWIEGIYKAKIK